MDIIKFAVSNGNPITSSQKLWSAMRGILYADELAHALNSMRVNSFKQFSPEWVVTLEDRIEKLNKAGGEWHEMRSNITSGFLTPFIRYTALFSSVNEKILSKEPATDSDIIQMFEALNEQAADNAKEMRSIKYEFCDWSNSVNNLFLMLEESVDEGWGALDVNEKSVSELTGKLAVIQNALADAQREILPTYLSEGYDFAKSYGEMVFSTLIGGEAISYLSVGGLFFSVGKIFFDALTSHADVVALAKELEECKLKFSLAQQALAQTKSLLRFLEELQLRVTSLRNELDGIVELWDDEKAFLNGLLISFQKGADPHKTNLVAENGTWKTVAAYANNFITGGEKTYNFSIHL